MLRYLCRATCLAVPQRAPAPRAMLTPKLRLRPFAMLLRVRWFLLPTHERLADPLQSLTAVLTGVWMRTCRLHV